MSGSHFSPTHSPPKRDLGAGGYRVLSFRPLGSVADGVFFAVNGVRQVTRSRRSDDCAGLALNVERGATRSLQASNNLVEKLRAHQPRIKQANKDSHQGQRLPDSGWWHPPSDCSGLAATQMTTLRQCFCGVAGIRS